MIERRCKGCGAVLQSKNPDALGFIPKLDENSKTCRRCFRMMHYNELPKIVATNEDYEKVIDEVVKKKALMVFIVDIFAFKSTFNKIIINRLKGKDVILLANKIDLLPKSVNHHKIVDWISKECKKLSFDVLVIGLISAKEKTNIDMLSKTISLARKERDVYFVGCANVGKSSLINALLKNEGIYNDDLIATSIIPGTTLKEIRIPYFIDNCAIVDTPGLINEADILNYLNPTSYKKIIPTNELKPKTYQLFSPSTIFLGGLAAISLEPKETCDFTIYASSNLYIHRSKLAKTDELFKTQLGKLLVPPTEDELKDLEYVLEKVKIEGKKDVWFSGFGFVQIKGNVEITIKRISKTEVYITDAIIGKN